MDQSYIILLVLLGTGLFLKNDSLSVAGAVLILLKLLKGDMIISKFESSGLKLGIIIITIGLLAPLAQDKYNVSDIFKSIQSTMGISALLGGAIIILFTSKGYNLLTTDPSIVVPIILGSIIGMIAFNGVPVGPLVASGVAVIIYNIANYIKSFLN